MSAEPASRHLPRPALEDYLQRASPSAISIAGQPHCRIVFDPPRRRMSLRTPRADEESLDLATFRHVEADVCIIDGTAWSQVSVDYADHAPEAYLLLTDIADMLQLRRHSFPTAVRSALATFEALLARTGGLTTEKQTGLYGELLLLETCLTAMNPQAAVDAWKGFASHEHDFVFPDACYEVKTTRAEKRVHRIGSLDQLTPVPGSPLWLISVQITSASARSGRTLGQLVDDVCDAAGGAGSALDAKLSDLGWRDDDRGLYPEPFALRSTPTGYLVDSRFPVLDREAVRAGCTVPDRIVDAAYTINITSLEPGRPPAPAHLFTQGGR